MQQTRIKPGEECMFCFIQNELKKRYRFNNIASMIYLPKINNYYFSSIIHLLNYLGKRFRSNFWC